VLVVVICGVEQQVPGLPMAGPANLAVDWVATPAKAPTASKARRLERRSVFIGGISPESCFLTQLQTSSAPFHTEIAEGSYQCGVLYGKNTARIIQIKSGKIISILAHSIFRICEFCRWPALPARSRTKGEKRPLEICPYLVENLKTRL
jgi:hypothetical protein